jgi:hypothetical protein
MRIVRVGLLFASIRVGLGGYESYRRIVRPLRFRVRVVLNFALSNFSLLGHGLAALGWVSSFSPAQKASRLLLRRARFTRLTIRETLYEWVLPVYRYEGLEPLLATLAEKVIAPAEGKEKALQERRRMIEAELTKPQIGINGAFSANR